MAPPSARVEASSADARAALRRRRGVERALTSALEPRRARWTRRSPASSSRTSPPCRRARGRRLAGAHLQVTAAGACAAGCARHRRHRRPRRAGLHGRGRRVRRSEGRGDRRPHSTARLLSDGEKARGPGKPRGGGAPRARGGRARSASRRRRPRRSPRPPPRPARRGGRGGLTVRPPAADVSFSVAFAPSYLAATVATYLASTRVPARLRSVGLFPTITGGVAMAGVPRRRVGAPRRVRRGAAGIREDCDGARDWRVNPAALAARSREGASPRAGGEQLRRRNAASVADAVPETSSLRREGGGGGLSGVADPRHRAQCTTTGLAVSMAADRRGPFARSPQGAR